MSERDHNRTGKLTWWQLSLVGVASTIGTGYFLGSVIGIQMAGQGILFSFLFAGTGTYFVFEALAKMAIENPEEGSFRTYGRQAFGNWAGFTIGWIYWFSEMLITGSQLTALSLLTKFWFPDVPLWIFTLGYGILGIIVVLIGTQGFVRSQNIFAIIKIGAILMFLILSVLVLFGFFGGSTNDFQMPNTPREFLPNGIFGLWASFIYGFYAYGGIEIMGMMSTQLKRRGEILKAGIVMVIVLTTIYLLSFLMATSLVSLDKFSTNESPFITALSKYRITIFPHLFTGGIITAGFSTLAASLFAVTSMVETLALDGDAPEIFAKKTRLKVPPFALGLTIFGLLVSIVLSFIIPDRVYEYVTTAAGLILVYIWFFILITYLKLMKESGLAKLKVFFGMILLVLAIAGTVFQRESRFGFFISLFFVVFVFLLLFIRRSFKKKDDGEGSLFVKLSFK